jgi:hypothetical protein
MAKAHNDSGGLARDHRAVEPSDRRDIGEMQLDILLA